jgi:hypothetical protein
MRWAPWWAYVIPIIALNYLRQIVIPPENDAVSVALFAVTAAAVVAVVTAIHRRSTRRPARPA